jgi:hypothetical protein
MKILSKVEYKGKHYYVLQETESFFLVSYNRKDKLFSVRKSEIKKIEK